MTTTRAPATVTPYLQCIRISITLSILTMGALLAAVLLSAPGWVYIALAALWLTAVVYTTGKADECRGG